LIWALFINQSLNSAQGEVKLPEYASEHLWAVARSLYPGDEMAAQGWVEPLLSQLKHGEETWVLQTLNDLPT
jgi:hypothetical protein